MRNEAPGFITICFKNVTKLILLNIFFLMCCLPVVTLPAATTALARTCQDILLEKERPYRSFFRTIRQDFFPSLLLGLVFMVLPTALAYTVLFYISQTDSFLAVLCAVFSFIVDYLLLCTGTVALNIFARIELPVYHIIRNAFIITFSAPKLLCTWISLSILLVGMGVWFFPYSLPYVALLAFSLSGMAASRGVLPYILEKMERNTWNE